MKTIKTITFMLPVLIALSALPTISFAQSTNAEVTGNVPKTSAVANKRFEIKDAVKYVKKQFNLQNSVFYEVGQVDGYYIFEFFYPDTIKSTNYGDKPVTQVWLAATNPKLGLLAKILGYVDCDHKLYGIKQYVVYGDFGTNMVSSKTYDNISFETAIPDSVGETLVGTVCTASAS